MEMMMRQNEERPARKNKPKKQAGDPDKKSQQQPPLPEGETLVPLGERLRQWSRGHDWYQGGHIHNHLALKRGFLKTVSTAVDGFLSHDHVKQAFQVKGDFDALLKLVKRFDKCFHKGCSEDHELQECEQLQEQIYAAIDDIAALLDNRDLENDSPAVPPAAPAVPFHPDQWVTFSKAAEILSVNKGTVSKWAKQNRFVDNGLNGQRRRLSTLSVLVVKQSLEERDIQKDIKDLRMDARRQDSRLRTF